MFSATSQKYMHEVPALSPQNMYVGSNGLIRNYTTLPSAKKSYMTIQTVVLTFSVLFCIFSSFLTVTLLYKWHTDTNVKVGRLEGTVSELVRDIGTLTDILKEEIAVRRLNDFHKEEPKNDKDENNYDDIEDDYDENRFMDKDLSDNKRPTKNNEGNDSRKIINRQRRNAEIDAAIKVKNELNSPNNEKSNVELFEEETTTEENAVKSYLRKSKKVGILKKKIQMEGEEIEDLKEAQEFVAAHFPSDSSKYNTKTHPHYNGNGRLRHPDGDFRDWTNASWVTYLNNPDYIQFKNGKVEISKPGLYYVYAQVYYSDQHDINGYYIMKNHEKVLGCTTTRHRETQSDSCYTGGLIYFNSNDILSIKGLDSERYILLDNAKTFFGLFKVSKDIVR